MSTRANIILKEGNDKLYFYRHSDGYPEGAMPILKPFMNWLKEGEVRNNIQQCAGWLTVLGALEYATIPEHTMDEEKSEFTGTIYRSVNIKSIQKPKDWKVGSIEPTTGIHGDIEFLYVIDLNKKEIKCFEDWTDKGEGTKEVNIEKELA